RRARPVLPCGRMRAPVVVVLALLACSSRGAPADVAPAPANAPPPTPATPVVVDAGTPSSHGSGGLACERTEDLGAGGTSCVTRVGTVELKIVEPVAGSGPLRFGLYVHGDGAAAHKSGSAVRAMLPWTDARRGLGVSALAPNGCSWWRAPEHDCD